jgi:hypothetical protein
MNRLTIVVLSLVCALVAAPAPVRAQDYQQLTPLLTDLNGWNAEPAEGVNMETGAFKMINAVRSYTQDSKELEAMIMIGNQAMPQGPMDAMHAESGDSVMNIREMNGFKVHTVHDKKENSGNVTVFLVQKETQGAIFAVSYQGIPESEAMDLARQFNWKAMKAGVEKMF